MDEYKTLSNPYLYWKMKSMKEFFIRYIGISDYTLKEKINIIKTSSLEQCKVKTKLPYQQITIQKCPLKQKT